MADTQSLIGSLATIPTSVTNSLDSLKDLSQSLTLLGLDIGIFVGYFLYILIFFVAIRGIFLAIKKYKENEKSLSKLFFIGLFTHKGQK